MEFIDLKKQYEVLKDNIDKNILKVLHDGKYIMGDEVKELEANLANYVGVKYCATCANGTDALQIALMCYGIKPGDCVFVPSFTFFSTAEIVSLLGATPIFVDVDERTFNMNPDSLEDAIKNVKKEGKLNLRGVIAVDLFGLPADYDKIRKIAKENDLFLVEDGAQGFGGNINDKRACSFGDISTTSFFPAKPLGCYGDGGAIFTDNEELYNLITSIRVHGKGTEKYDNVRIGLNSRLDTIQAAILLEKLKAFENDELDNRQVYANMYYDELKDYVKVPLIPEGYLSSYAQYTLILDSEEERNFLQKYLKDNGVPSMVYYAKPLHSQKVYANIKLYTDLSVSENLSKTVLSIPMHPYLTIDLVKEVTSKIISGIEEYRHE